MDDMLKLYLESKKLTLLDLIGLDIFVVTGTQRGGKFKGTFESSTISAIGKSNICISRCVWFDHKLEYGLVDEAVIYSFEDFNKIWFIDIELAESRWNKKCVTENTSPKND